MVKLDSLYAALRKADWCSPRIVFIRQHDMPALGSHILNEFGIDHNQVHEIALPSADHGTRLGAMVSGYSAILATAPTDLVLVFGDVDTTLAGALAAKRAQLPLAHIEAGLRSGDSTMPEEINRRLVDAISDMHFATSTDAVDNLRHEGHHDSSLHLVGNPMIDTIHRHLDREAGVSLCQQHGLVPGNFAIATFHRPANVDTRAALGQLAQSLQIVASRMPVWMPMHPRTQHAIHSHGMTSIFEGITGLQLAKPQSYLDFIALISHARLIVTDSGGLQEETSWLGIPCLTLRPNTERPITISLGTNQLVTLENLASRVEFVLSTPMPGPATIPLWDGLAGERITTILSDWWKEMDGNNQ